MAVSKAVESSKMVLRVQSGLDGAGKAVYKNVSLSGLNPAAADADVVGRQFAVALLIQIVGQAAGCRIERRAVAEDVARKCRRRNFAEVVIGGRIARVEFDI